MDASLRGKRVTVMGLGRFGGGVGVTCWLCAQGARVTVSDQASRTDLAASVGQLAGLEVQLHLGGHDPKDLVQCDLLVANPAVPFDSPYLGEARRAGVPITTEINLFFQRCPAPIVGITGSAGKSTTTAMIGAILSRVRTTHVGGNIGKSLLLDLARIAPDHLVVLELSSFQLSYLGELGKSPHVAVVTNLQPNHLDRHKDLEDYASAKKNIFRYQTSQDVLVLNRQDAAVAAWQAQARGRVEFFDSSGQPFELRLPGAHNQLNAQAAWAAASSLGVGREVAAKALEDFAGLPHRLQLVQERAGVRYFNDSKSTSPCECRVALESFPPRSLVVIVGGYDKRIPLEGLCGDLAKYAKGVVATGQTGRQIAQGVLACRQGPLPAVACEQDFAAAVAAACQQARRGDVVLLSPACASYDQFRNYQERGELFMELVQRGGQAKPLATAVAELKARFQAIFGRACAGVIRSPGRVNLIGEHTDYNDGFVLPIAIDRGVLAAYAPRSDRQVNFHSLQAEPPVTVNLEGQLTPVPSSWSNYPVGVVSELLKAGVKLGGADVIFSSDLPLGGGLSSSAALEVATALALLEACGKQGAVQGRDLALLCQRAENLFAGAPCGIMDQSIVVMGQAGKAMLLDCRSGQVRQAPFDDPGLVLLVADTQVKHNIGDGGYPLRRRQCQEAARKLAVKALRDVTAAQLAKIQAEKILEGQLLQRVRHVVGEIERTLKAVEALEKHKYIRFGRLMYKSHASLRDDYQVSCEELDAIVESARTCPGVYGARMTGGGFGGCAIVLVPRALATQAGEKIAGDFEQRFGRRCPIFTTIAAGGAAGI